MITPPQDIFEVKGPDLIHIREATDEYYMTRKQVEEALHYTITHYAYYTLDAWNRRVAFYERALACLDGVK